jgi:hypothetical protein
MSDKTKEPTPKQDQINDAEVRAYEQVAFVNANINLMETAHYTTRRNLESLATALKCVQGTQDEPAELRKKIMEKMTEMVEALQPVEIYDSEDEMVLSLYLDPNCVEDADFVEDWNGSEPEVDDPDLANR